MVAIPYSVKGGKSSGHHYGVSGGTFSSGTGIVVDASTGEIDLSLSLPGTYEVLYTHL